MGNGSETLEWVRVQSNYHIKNGWVAGYRYGMRDSSDQQNDKTYEYTYQISKYFVGHNLKINADYGYINEEQATAGADDKQTRTFRIQAQLKF